jgi:hypothetical protein
MAEERSRADMPAPAPYIWKMTDTEWADAERRKEIADIKERLVVALLDALALNKIEDDFYKANVKAREQSKEKDEARTKWYELQQAWRSADDEMRSLATELQKLLAGAGSGDAKDTASES